METQKLKCPYCESNAVLERSTKIYRKDYGYIWICEKYPDCDSYVGCHRGTKNPLGRLADKQLRKWKSLAHFAFDDLWLRKMKTMKGIRKKSVARSKGYKWLANQLQINQDECHIGMFDSDKCKKVIEICFPYLSLEKRNKIQEI